MIFTAIGTLLAGTATISLFGASISLASVIAGGLSFAASLGLQYLKRPKKRTYTAVQGETELGGNVPVGTLFGTGKTKGQRTFYAKWGSGNKYNAEVFLLANGWCDGLEPYVYIHGEKWGLHQRPLIGNEVMHYGVNGYTSNNVELFSIRFYDGRPGQGVDQKLVNDTANLGQTWKSTSVNAGITYVVVERLYDAEAFGGKGKPEIEFVLRGLREYDFRNDSTVVGGSGPQRLADPSTWTHTNNPAVHRLNYQLGLRAMVSGRTLIGEGKSLGQIDIGSYAVAMNVCDALRTDGKKTYQCSLWSTGEDDHTEVLKEFDDAMAGYGLNRRGLSGVIAGAPQIPVLEITADDIPTDRAKDFQYRKSAFDRYNHLSGQFTSIESMWNPESLTPVFRNADIAEDGRNRQVSNDFLQVTDPDLAQYLLNIRYRQNRKGATATLPVSRRVGLKVAEGEWVTWRGREWMISEWTLDEKLRPTLKLTETGADIYDDEGIDPGPVIIPPAPVVNPSLLSTVQNFGVLVDAVGNADGFQTPVLKFVWTPPADPTIIAVRIEYKAVASSQILTAACDTPEAGEYTINTNIVPTAVYSARATITTIPDRAKSYTAWATTAGPTPDIKIVLANLTIEIREALEQLRDWIDDGTIDGLVQQTEELAEQLGEEQSARVDGAIEASDRFRTLVDEITALRDRAMEADFADYQAREEIKRSLTVSIETYSASFDERIVVAASDIASVAQRTTTLEASSVELAAQISAVDIARIEGDNALAYQMSLLSAGTDNQFDPYKFWGFAGDFEGWTGNGAPTVTDGYLRPADHATDPYVTSPSGLAVATASYRQVRARVRKYGAPVWEGQCWWAAIAEGWDAGRRTTIAEPAFDGNGIGLLTWNPEWSGAIDRIRIDLSAAQTAADYYTIDWISVGAPAPGASRAELAAERQARIDGDSANASDILALETRATDLETGVSGLASGVSALETEVSTLGDAVTATGNALDALALEVADKAELDVVNAMSAEITALGSGLLNQGSMVSAIRGSLLPSAMEGVDQDFANFLGGQKAAGALAEASQALNTRIDLTNASLTIVAEAVTQVQAVIPSLATATGLNALTTRVTAAEGAITAHTSAINAINAELPNKASVSALNSLSATVSDLDGVVSAHAAAITGLEANVGDLSASARVKMEVVAGPAGYSRIGWMARTGTAEDFRTGGIYLDVPTNAALPVEVIIDASRLAVIDGATKKVPFIIDAGKIYLSADVYIERAIVGDLVVGTHNIELGAVTVMDLADGYGVTLGTSSGDFRTLAAIAIEHGLGSPKVRIDWTTIRGSPVEYRIRNATTGLTFFTYQMGNPGAAGTLAWSSFHQDVPPAHIATSVYLIEGWTPMGAGITHPFAAISAITLKR